MTPNELIAKAKEALHHAYAPYSNYTVGSALLCGDGTVYTGCNVENASFGLTNCAERTALFKAVSEGRTEFLSIAIASTMEPVPFPCGACRQVLAEFCDSDLTVYVAEKKGYRTTTLGELLPMSFNFGDAGNGE